MKIVRALYSLIIFCWVFAIAQLSFVGEASAQSPLKIYENRQFRFAITPPPGWSEQQSVPSKIKTVVKFVDSSGTLTVAARPAQNFHKKIIGLFQAEDGGPVTEG